MRRRIASLPAVCALALGAHPALASEGAGEQAAPLARTMTTGAFTVDWSPTDPEKE
jgi:hypothetical protein